MMKESKIAAGRPGGYTRDDRILPETRGVAALILPFLLIAFAILYFQPDRTDQFFAWAVKPRMMPLLMGAGYIAGAYFFFRVLLERQWHHIAVGFLPVSTFATVLALATILHWDRFNHQHISFFAWAALYATTPFVVLIIWFRNRHNDPGTPDPDDVFVPLPTRWTMAIVGMIILGIGLFIFLLPTSAARVWPWSLTALTARVLGGWFVLPGVFGLVIAADPRWSSARIAFQSQTIGIVLILIGVARAWDVFDTSNPATWLFTGGMGLMLAAIGLLYIWMEARRKRERPRLTEEA